MKKTLVAFLVLIMLLFAAHCFAEAGREGVLLQETVLRTEASISGGSGAALPAGSRVMILAEEVNQGITWLMVADEGYQHMGYIPATAVEEGGADAVSVRGGVPVLSEKYPGVAAHLREYSSSNKEGRRQAKAGPGDQFADAGAYKPYKQQGVTAFYAEGDWVFVLLNYQSVEDRYLYFKSSSFDKLGDVPQEPDLYYFTGTVIETVRPLWGPGSEYQAEPEFEVPAGAEVRIFFQENGYFFAEFISAGEAVRMWLPKAQVEVAALTPVATGTDLAEAFAW